MAKGFDPRTAGTGPGDPDPGRNEPLLNASEGMERCPACGAKLKRYADEHGEVLMCEGNEKHNYRGPKR